MPCTPLIAAPASKPDDSEDGDAGEQEGIDLENMIGKAPAEATALAEGSPELAQAIVEASGDFEEIKNSKNNKEQLRTRAITDNG